MGRYPILKLVFPLALGIWVGDVCPSAVYLYLFFAALVLKSCLTPKRMTTLPHLLSEVWVVVTCFLLGGATCYLHRADPLPEQERGCFRWKVITPPQEKARSFAVEAELLGSYSPQDSIGSFQPLSGRYLLYLAKETRAARLQIGDELVGESRLRSFVSDMLGERNTSDRNEETSAKGGEHEKLKEGDGAQKEEKALNEEGVTIGKSMSTADHPHFNYAEWARRHGYSGSCYMDSARWVPCNQTMKKENIRMRMSRLRMHILRYVEQAGWDPREYAVFSALTLGYKQGLTEEIRDSYSSTGASHLLALSGLHIGMLYTLMLIPLTFIRRRFPSIYLPIRLIAIIMMWMFALLTGLAASTCRSVCMFTLLTFSSPSSYDRRNMGVHNLLTAVFFLLIFRPYWLFDVGFQLSVAGVGSIILFHPVAERMLTLPKGVQLLQPLVSLAAVSVTAQIGTLPLMAHYFGTFSPYFLPASYVGIPLLTLILYGSILWVLLLWLSPAAAMIGSALGQLTQWLNDFLYWLSTFPHSSLTIPKPDGIECLLLYLCLGALLRLLTLRSYRSLCLLEVLILLTLIYHYFIA